MAFGLLAPYIALAAHIGSSHTTHASMRLTDSMASSTAKTLVGYLTGARSSPNASPPARAVSVYPTRCLIVPAVLGGLDLVGLTALTAVSSVSMRGRFVRIESIDIEMI